MPVTFLCVCLTHTSRRRTVNGWAGWWGCVGVTSLKQWCPEWLQRWLHDGPSVQLPCRSQVEAPLQTTRPPPTPCSSTPLPNIKVIPKSTRLSSFHSALFSPLLHNALTVNHLHKDALNTGCETCYHTDRQLVIETSFLFFFFYSFFFLCPHQPTPLLWCFGCRVGDWQLWVASRWSGWRVNE